MHINRHQLDNGLTLLHVEDATTQMVTLNTLYRVGSRNEHPDHTGFAHLFEHLMFGGSVHIPDFDEPLQQACGENNAFTTEDYTNYYTTLPAANVETAFWLESDRMLSLAFTPESLEVQRKVVMEEFKLSYLNQPYGDVGHLLSELCDAGTPYAWPTIGRALYPIGHATMPQVRDFFRRFYRPDNAILAVVGNISWAETLRLTEKWYGPIRPATSRRRTPPLALPFIEQTKERRKRVTRDVPESLLLMAFHIPSRMSPDFHAYDMITDVLSNGKSSRFDRRLVREQQLFLSLDAYVAPRLGPSLLLIEGVLAENVTMAEAEQAVWTELRRLWRDGVSPEELEKQKNKFETDWAIRLTNYQNVARYLAYSEMLGDVNRMTDDPQRYAALTAAEVQDAASRLFRRANASVLYYQAK
jgi:predicted Zn-dependent peptidase